MPCCLCSHPEAPHLEARPSGTGFRLQQWAFCSPCWKELTRQRADYSSIVIDNCLWFLHTLFETPPEASRIEAKRSVDNSNSVMTELHHAYSQCEDSGRTPQTIPDSLHQRWEGDERACSKMDRGLRGEDRKKETLTRTETESEPPASGTDP
jgi:hypothetical protein